MLVHFLEHFIYDSYPVSTPLLASVNQGMKDAFFFLFAGKSYTIFALLFGFTYAIQYGKPAPQGKRLQLPFRLAASDPGPLRLPERRLLSGRGCLAHLRHCRIDPHPLRKLGIGTLAMVAAFFLLQPLELAYAAIQFFHPEWTPPTVLAANAYPSLKPCIDNGDFWGMAWNNLTTGQYASFAWESMPDA